MAENIPDLIGDYELDYPKLKTFFEDIVLQPTTKISSTDELGEVLEDKLLAGTGITLIKTVTGGVETLTIAASGASLTDQLVKVSTNDTTPSFLDDELVVGAGLTKTILTPGFNETLEIKADLSNLGNTFLRLDAANGPMTGNLAMGNNDLTGIKDLTVDGVTTLNGLMTFGSAGTDFITMTGRVNSDIQFAGGGDRKISIFKSAGNGDTLILEGGTPASSGTQDGGDVRIDGAAEFGGGTDGDVLISGVRGLAKIGRSGAISTVLGDLTVNFNTVTQGYLRVGNSTDAVATGDASFGGLSSTARVFYDQSANTWNQYRLAAGQLQNRIEGEDGGKTIFNELGDDIGFRIEGQGNPSAFSLIGSTGFVGFGVGTASEQVDINGNIKFSGVSKGGDGTAALPSYTFTNDLDMGMYRVASNQLGLSVNGTEHIRLGNDGTGFFRPIEMNAIATTTTTSQNPIAMELFLTTKVDTLDGLLPTSVGLQITTDDTSVDQHILSKGVRINSNFNSTSIINLASPFFVEANHSGSGTIAELDMVFIGAPLGSGTITDLVGLKIANMAAGSGDNRAIESDGGEIYFVGNTLIGSVGSATHTLQVVGDISLSGELEGCRADFSSGDSVASSADRYMKHESVLHSATKGFVAERDGSIVSISVNFNVTVASTGKGPQAIFSFRHGGSAGISVNVSGLGATGIKSGDNTQARDTGGATFSQGDILSFHLDNTTTGTLATIDDITIKGQVVYDD